MKYKAVKWISIVFLAFEIFKENKVRTILSLSGIMIGITSIVLVISVNESGRELIFKELETFGLRSIWLSRDRGDYYQNRDNYVRGSGIFDEDYQAISVQKCCDSLLGVSPIINVDSASSVSFRGRVIRANVTGVNQKFYSINNEHLNSGRFLEESDIVGETFVAVISQDVANIILKSGVRAVLGQRIKISSNWFTIVGILSNKSRDFISSIGANKENANIRILAPYTTIQKINGRIREISYLQGEAISVERANKAVKELKQMLSFKYRNVFQYKGETMAQYIETANSILKNISLVGIITAIVSLVVGGLAVLNVMFMSVFERTREIGIRKSVGAKNADILVQFVSESVLITTTGGVMGIILAFLIVYSVQYFYQFDVVMSSVGLLTGLLSTISVGMVSGIYPAIKAANLEPVESLRYE